MACPEIQHHRLTSTNVIDDLDEKMSKDNAINHGKELAVVGGEGSKHNQVINIYFDIMAVLDWCIVTMTFIITTFV